MMKPRRLVGAAILAAIAVAGIYAASAAADRERDPAEVAPSVLTRPRPDTGPIVDGPPPLSEQPEPNLRINHGNYGVHLDNLTPRAKDALTNPAYRQKWIGLVRTPDGKLDVDRIVDDPRDDPSRQP